MRFGLSVAVMFAAALQPEKKDPREWVEPGETVTTAIAFDISPDTTGIRLRSEILGIDVPLGVAD